MTSPRPERAAARALAAGMKILKAGNPAKARAVFTAALADAPGDVGLIAALATVHNLLHHYQAAERLCEGALRQAPHHPALLTELGNALAAEGRYGPASRAYAHALKGAPDLLAAEEGLGQCAYVLGDFAASADAWQRVCAARPDYAAGALHLGHALRAAGRAEAALAAFDSIPPDHPTAAEAAYGKGCALQHLGRMEEARAALRRALDLHPTSARYHRMLAGLKKFTPADPQLAEMQTLAEKADRLPEKEQIELHFALAKALEDIGEYEAGFRHLSRGNALKRQSFRYNEAEQLAIIKRIRRAWPGEVCHGAATGSPSALPIFIIGMPRSGTSLLEQILASHPDVAGAGETTLFGAAVKAARAAPLGLPPPADGETLHRIGAHYVAALQTRVPGAKHIVDKLPGNFLYAGLIHRALPNAKIIHIRRAAENCCFSCYAALFTHGHHYAYDLAELARYYRASQELTTHWQKVLPADAYHTLDYEDLVNAFPATVKAVLAFCHLDWDDACLRFHKTPRTVMTASAVEVRRPLFRAGLERAKPYHAMLEVLRENLK